MLASSRNEVFENMLRDKNKVQMQESKEGDKEGVRMEERCRSVLLKK